jgi:DNA-binding NtrC family response regulator
MTKFKDSERPVVAAEMHELYYKGTQEVTRCPTCGNKREGRPHSFDSIAKLYDVSGALVATMVGEHSRWDLNDELPALARKRITAALLVCGGNKTKAAALLGAPSYQTLTNWIQQYDVKESDDA